MSYQQIPDYPENYSSGNIISRFIDGLGYRYYWATEELTDKDLKYKPSAEGKSTYETIEHLYWLSIMILDAPQHITSIRLTKDDLSKITFKNLRENTLHNLKKASELCAGKTANDIAVFTVRIQKGEDTLEFPFWNMMNGPISDALYHTGQIVSFRRSSGNPIHPRVSVFLGKTKEL
ncbi:hypothetical protein [Aquimarina longa]|uniref:hypothetical protein n=1 Tax=Aquimarina longa TaxID=1080221 RepID=UPI000784BB55|nr:hypothetical protein [Aquimarina longa]